LENFTLNEENQNFEKNFEEFLELLAKLHKENGGDPNTQN
jgi:hypothetical protein